MQNSRNFTTEILTVFDFSLPLNLPMNLSSWFRRKLLRENGQFIGNSIPRKQSDKEDQLYGITDNLIDFVKSFTFETFKNFPLLDEGEANCDNENLSDWQEQHAVIVLSKVKVISQLRFKLCPRHLNEHQFWRIYFALVKSLVTEYELRAIQVDKLKRMAIGNEETSNCSPYEVEMAETNAASRLTSVSPPTP